MKHRRLQELDRSDFRIVDGEPDIRGWDVKNNNRQKIGEVEELILDAHEKKVRYMVVDLKDNELRIDRRKVLIPIGLAELDKRDDDVLIPNASPEQLAALPPYDRNDLTPDVERTILTTLNSKTQAPVTDASKGSAKPEAKNRSSRDEVDPDFYRHESYNLDNLYKNRMHQARPANDDGGSEYERGLRLWERRSEGTVIPGDRTKQDATSHEEFISDNAELDDESRQELIRSRRDTYRRQRYPDGNQGKSE